MSDSQTIGDSQGPLSQPDQAGAGASAASAQTSGRDWLADHPVNIRLSIPLGFGRYYLTIVGGKERRGAERLEAERRKHPLLTVGNMIVLAVVFAMSTVTGVVALHGILWAVTAFLQEQGSVVVFQ